MFIILKTFLRFVQLLNSETAPSQLASGVMFGAFVGLTPFFSLHNLIIFLVVCLFRVNLSMFFISTAFFAIMGWMLDPLLDALGYFVLVDITSLRPLFLKMSDFAFLPFFKWNNTVVMGSFVLSLLISIPLFFGAYRGVTMYRAHWRESIAGSRAMKWLKATKIYGIYEKVNDLKQKAEILS